MLHIVYVAWNMLYLRNIHFFVNGLNYYVHFIIKELAKEFEREFNCLEEDAGKYKNFSVPIGNPKVIRISEKKKKSQKPYLTDYNLLKVEELWPGNYQILLIILPKILNANVDIMIRNVKHAGLNIETVIVFLNKQTLKMI